MSVVRDIALSWRAPGAVMRRHLAGGVREDRALITLMAACLLLFVAQWPGLARAAFEAPEVPLDARLAGALMAMLFVAPPVFYALAALSHLIARAMFARRAGAPGGFGAARMALFWALLAVTPGALFQGLVAGFVGPGPVATGTGLVVLAAFLAIWGACLRVAELEPPAATP